jgi:hypothetical protein
MALIAGFAGYYGWNFDTRGFTQPEIEPQL